MSWATRNASRVVLTKSPSSASLGANATECRSKSTRSVCPRTSWKNLAISSSLETSQGKSGTFRATKRSQDRSEEHTSELQSRRDLVCRLLLEKKKEIYSDSKVAELSRET